MMRITIFYILSIIGAYVRGSALPNDVTPCSTNLTPDQYNSCILKQVQIITPHLVKGVRTLNLPPLDPFRIPSLFVDRTLDSLKVKANLRNVQIFGGSQYVIQELKANPHDLSVTLKISFSHLEVSGEYDLQGRLLLLPLVGAGNFKGNFSDIVVYATASGKELTDKKGVRRVEVDKLVIKSHVGGGKIKLVSSKQSQVIAADAVTNFFNGNPRLVLDIASPIVDDTAAAVAKGLAARALATLAKDEILP